MPTALTRIHITPITHVYIKIPPPFAPTADHSVINSGPAARLTVLVSTTDAGPQLEPVELSAFAAVYDAAVTAKHAERHV